MYYFTQLIGIITLLAVVATVAMIIYMIETRASKVIAEYNRSAGTFDDPAKSALETYDGLSPRKKAKVRPQHAKLLEFNIGADEHVVPSLRHQAIRTAAQDHMLILDDLNAVDTTLDPLHDFEDFLVRNTALFDDTEINAMTTRIQDRAPTLVGQSVEQRQQRAVASANNHLQASQNYLKESIVYANDPQNVHDTKVNDKLRATLATFRTSWDGTDYINDIRGAVGHYCRDDKAHKADAARQAINRMDLGDTIYTYNETERNILNIVWARTLDPRNEAAKELMQEAIFDALADCVENGTMVCINGRASRVLNSLTLLDCDPSTGAARTFAAYKNQIFEETKRIIEDTLKETAADPRYSVAVEAYRDISKSCSDAEAEALADLMNKKIIENVEKYAGQLSASEIDRMKTEATAAV
jgi:hypothetical protein